MFGVDLQADLEFAEVEHRRARLEGERGRDVAHLPPVRMLPHNARECRVLVVERIENQPPVLGQVVLEARVAFGGAADGEEVHPVPTQPGQAGSRLAGDGGADTEIVLSRGSGQHVAVSCKEQGVGRQAPRFAKVGDLVAEVGLQDAQGRIARVGAGAAGGAGGEHERWGCGRELAYPICGIMLVLRLDLGGGS